MTFYSEHKKTLDKIFKYKIQKIKNKLTTTKSPIWLFGRPHERLWPAPTQNPDPTPLLVPRVQCRPPGRGSLNKVSSWAASIAVTVNPPRAPGHRVHFYLLAHRRASALLSLHESKWLLLESSHWCYMGS